MTVQLKMRPDATINEMTNELHKQFASARDAQNRADRASIRAGQLLIALRTRIEAGEAGKNVDWLKWCDENIVLSKRNARRVMKCATDDEEGVP